MRIGFYGLSLVLFTACSGMPQLRMEASRSPIDESVSSPNYRVGSFKKIMVIPPSGTVRGYHDTIIAIFERELLRHGITVISGAVTGRVVLEATADKRNESGSSLSDAERALIMAKKSGADAILQVGDWTWSKETPRRFFIFEEDSKEKAYREVSAAEYQNFSGINKHSFSSAELTFVGRLTNVENGEVVASFEIRSPANFNLPYPYLAKLEIENDRPVVKAENFSYGKFTWAEDAKKLTEVNIIKSVCNRISAGSKAASTGSAPSTTYNPAAPKIDEGAKTEERQVAGKDAPVKPSNDESPATAETGDSASDSKADETP